MWKLVCSRGNLDAEGKLRTLNAHVGRQTWEFDANASEEDVQKQEERRKEFRENRSVQKHSKDALMRDAFDAQRKGDLSLSGKYQLEIDAIYDEIEEIRKK